MKKKDAGGGKGGLLRLDKYLADMGLGSRSQIREGARKGKIRVDGAVETNPERKIDPQAAEVTWDGQPVAYVSQEYYMLNKPQGVVSATEDKLHRTAVDLIADRRRKDLFPVGRLDIDTEGLLLITNDGDLAHRLLSPKKHVDKTYYAEVEGRLPEDAAERFRAGIILKDGTETMPAVLRMEDGLSSWDEGGPNGRRSRNKGGSDGMLPQDGKDSRSLFSQDEGGHEPRQAVLLTIREGKFHQVKRMFEALGCKVTYLKRISMGNLRLDETLRPGQYRPLTEQEIEMLKKQSRSGRL